MKYRIIKETGEKGVLIYRIEYVLKFLVWKWWQSDLVLGDYNNRFTSYDEAKKALDQIASKRSKVIVEEFNYKP